MLSPMSFTGVTSIIIPNEPVSLRILGDKGVYYISNITSMKIFEDLADEKLTGEANIGCITYCKEEAIEDVINEYLLTPAQAEASKKVSKLASFGPPIGSNIKIDTPNGIWSPCPGSCIVSSVLPAIVSGKELTNDVSFTRTQSWVDASTQEDFIPSSCQPADSETLISLGTRNTRNIDDSSVSSLRIETVLRARKEYTLRKAEPFFTDSRGYYLNIFRTKLEGLSGRTSEGPLCVERYLVQSEKDWLKHARMGKQRSENSASLNHQTSNNSPTSRQPTEDSDNDSQGHFLLQGDYYPPTALKKFFLLRVGEWPLYSFFIAYVSLSKITLVQN